MDELKKKYNHLIQREKNAEKWFEREDISQEEKEKQLPNFKKIVFALEDLIKEFKKRGYEMTSEEITEGFKEVNNG